MTVILGIDPGSRVTGFGLIISHRNKLEYVNSGCIKTQTKLLPQRLKIIFDQLCGVIAVSYTHLTLPTKRIV